MRPPVARRAARPVRAVRFPCHRIPETQRSYQTRRPAHVERRSVNHCKKWICGVSAKTRRKPESLRPYHRHTLWRTQTIRIALTPGRNASRRRAGAVRECEGRSVALTSALPPGFEHPRNAGLFLRPRGTMHALTSVRGWCAARGAAAHRPKPQSAAPLRIVLARNLRRCAPLFPVWFAATIYACGGSGSVPRSRSRGASGTFSCTPFPARPAPLESLDALGVELPDREDSACGGHARSRNPCLPRC